MLARPSFLKQVTLYKFRYILGYSILAFILILIVTLDIRSLPNGVNAAEMQSAVASNAFWPNLSFDWIINWPYLLLQKISLFVFGVSRLSLVLPSLLIGCATMILFAMTLHQWFRSTVAVIATSVAVTSIPFITLTRSATPDVMLSFWTILLLFGAVRLLIKHDRPFLWKFVIVIAAVGLLYTPLGIYPLVSFLIGGLLHPHVRSRLRRMRKHRVIILSIFTVLAITPLVIRLIIEPSDISTLTGAAVFREALAHPLDNVRVLYEMYINVTQNSFLGGILIPIFNVTSILVMLLGLFRSIKDRHTARSYVMLSWAAVTALVILFDPTTLSLVLMPSMLLLAIGIQTLVTDWYDLFPLNPYARIAGLVPLSVLFIGIALGNLTHYFYTYRYVANPTYNVSLSAIKTTLNNAKGSKITLISDTPSLEFYKLLTKKYPALTITTDTTTPVSQPTMVVPQVTVPYTQHPSRILTSEQRDNSVVLRVYRP